MAWLLSSIARLRWPGEVKAIHQKEGRSMVDLANKDAAYVVLDANPQ